MTNKQANESGQSKPSSDSGEKQVQETVDAENEQGFRGTKVDPTPNENYTLQGVVDGAPTPETDPQLAQEVRQRFTAADDVSASSDQAK